MAYATSSKTLPSTTWWLAKGTSVVAYFAPNHVLSASGAVQMAYSQHLQRLQPPRPKELRTLDRCQQRGRVSEAAACLGSPYARVCLPRGTHAWGWACVARRASVQPWRLAVEVGSGSLQGGLTRSCNGTFQRKRSRPLSYEARIISSRLHESRMSESRATAARVVCEEG